MFFLIYIVVRLPSVVVFVLFSQILFIDIANLENTIFLVNIGGFMTIDFNESAQSELIFLAALLSIFHYLIKLAPPF